MCTNCAPYRDCSAGAHHTTETAVATSDWLSIDSRVHAPLSRRQMLKAVGGGLAGAITAGAFGWNLAATDAASLPYVVLIVLDGAMPEYFNISGIPHVKSLIRNGTQYSNAFSGILESETPSA